MDNRLTAAFPISVRSFSKSLRSASSEPVQESRSLHRGGGDSIHIVPTECSREDSHLDCGLASY